MPTPPYVLYFADEHPEGGWLVRAYAAESLEEAMQRGQASLDPKREPYDRVAIYQLVEVLKEEP